MSWLKHPIVGDPVYGGRMRIPPAANESVLASLRNFQRQALHATELGLIHPATKQPVSWQAALPDDMEKLLVVLREWEAS